jgi:hypothetical protein
VKCDWIGYPEAEGLDVTQCDGESVLDYCYGAVPAHLLTGGRSFVGFASGAIVPDPTGRDMCPMNVYED